jgi:CBS domain-containing protein
VLRAKHSDHWVEYTISRSSSLHDAIDVMITRDLSGLMVVDLGASVNELTRQRGKVLGMISSRDLLRRIHQHSLDEWSLDAVHGELVESFMTPLASLVFARPEETVAKASEVMAHTDRVMLPVISSEGRVEGIVTAKDFLGFGVQAKEKGGKEAYLKDMAGRTGAEQTSMAEPPE